MSNAKIPEGYQHVMPYIMVKDAHKFKQFLEDVFDAKEKYMYLNEDGSIMHGEMSISDSVVMFAEPTDKWGPDTCSMFVYVDDADNVYNKAVKSGAVVLNEISDQSYGRSGGVKDPWGNTWWITSVIK